MCTHRHTHTHTHTHTYTHTHTHTHAHTHTYIHIGLYIIRILTLARGTVRMFKIVHEAAVNILYIISQVIN